MKTSLQNERFFFLLCKKQSTFKKGCPDRIKHKWIKFFQITISNERVLFIGLRSAIISFLRLTAFGMQALPAVSSHELGGQEGSRREGLEGRTGNIPGDSF